MSQLSLLSETFLNSIFKHPYFLVHISKVILCYSLNNTDVKFELMSSSTDVLTFIIPCAIQGFAKKYSMYVPTVQ